MMKHLRIQVLLILVTMASALLAEIPVCPIDTIDGKAVYIVA